MEDVTVRKMGQLHDGSLGRLESHDFGIPVYSRAEQIPDFGGSVFITASSAIRFVVTLCLERNFLKLESGPMADFSLCYYPLTATTNHDGNE